MFGFKSPIPPNGTITLPKTSFATLAEPSNFQILEQDGFIWHDDYFYSLTTGTFAPINPSYNYSSCDKFDVFGGETYRKQYSYGYIYFWNGSTFLGYVKMHEGLKTDEEYSQDYIFIAPSNATKAAFSVVGTTYNNPTYLYRTSAINDSEKAISIPKLEVPSNQFVVADGAIQNRMLAPQSITGDKFAVAAKGVLPLYGKKIVNFGDSIFGRIRNNTSVSSIIANRTGATVYNVAFAGTRMSTHSIAGYISFSMFKLADAIVDNIYTEQDAEVPSGETYFVNQLAILKSIDFSTVDIITIAFGTNDFTAGKFLINEADDDDTTYYIGALRYSLNKIISAYPHIKVVLITPYFRFNISGVNATIVDTSDDYVRSGTNFRLIDFVNALKDVGKIYHIPVIDCYDNPGINILNCTTYIPINDGTHHNDVGRKLLGEYIGAQLESYL